MVFIRKLYDFLSFLFVQIKHFLVFDPPREERKNGSFKLKVAFFTLVWSGEFSQIVKVETLHRIANFLYVSFS